MDLDQTKNQQVGRTMGKEKKVAMYIYVLPNLMTTANLFFGFFATILAMRGEFLYASGAIVAAALFDQLDGRLARLTRSTSKFGAEYDSLCDLVSFGMAPAILMFMWALEPFGRTGWLACFLYCACAALRLARFNVQVGIVEKNYFQGLPSPMAAGIVASSVLAFHDLQLDASRNYGLLAMTILLAIVMVSNFRYRSFKDLDLKERMPFRTLVIGVSLIVIVAWWWEVMLFAVFVSYAALGAVYGVFRLGKKVRSRPNVYAPAPQIDEEDLIEDEDGETVEEDEDNRDH